MDKDSTWTLWAACLKQKGILLFIRTEYQVQKYHCYVADEAALVYMAYHCVNDSTYSDKENAALNYILNHQDSKGLFGNEYSTALALQVVFSIFHCHTL